VKNYDEETFWGTKESAEGRPSAIVLTSGHSARSLEAFIGLLRAHSATRVVDVRTLPKPRHNHRFNRDYLPGSLKKDGLDYVHLQELGGLHYARHDSVNLGWRNASLEGIRITCRHRNLSRASTNSCSRQTRENRRDVRRRCAAALSSFAHWRGRLDSCNPHRGHQKCNTPSGSYFHDLCQGLWSHDHIPGLKTCTVLKRCRDVSISDHS